MGDLMALSAKSRKFELISEAELIQGKHSVMPAKPYRARVGDEELIDWGIGKNIVDGKNMNVYGKNQFFPSEVIELQSTSQMRKWKFVKLVYYPIQYNPATNALRYTPSVRVVIKYRKYSTLERIDTLMLRDKVMDVEARERFYNLGKLTNEWYGPLSGDDLEPLPAPYDYVIITCNDIVTGSGTKWDDFITHKTSQGHSVLVVTEDDYGTLAAPAPNGTAEKIRQWLIDNYITYGIKWVLLVGDPDPDDPSQAADDIGDVPMKMCWPNKHSYHYRESPTDYFYSDLTSNWDLDGDLYFGEGYDVTFSKHLFRYVDGVY